MMVLIWSKEKNVIEELLKTYWILFLNNEVNKKLFLK